MSRIHWSVWMLSVTVSTLACGDDQGTPGVAPVIPSNSATTVQPVAYEESTYEMPNMDLPATSPAVPSTPAQGVEEPAPAITDAPTAAVEEAGSSEDEIDQASSDDGLDGAEFPSEDEMSQEEPIDHMAVETAGEEETCGDVDENDGCEVCACDNCFQEIDACFNDPSCKAVVDCARRTGCGGIGCFLVCGDEINTAGGLGSPQVTNAIQLGDCRDAQCTQECS